MVGQPRRNFMEMASWSRASEHLVNPIGMSDQLKWNNQRLEKKLKTIPAPGDKLAVLPIMISLVRNYIKKEYTDVPIGTVIAIISALIYVLSPADIIPDGILGVGYLDDAAVVTICWKLVKSDVEEYKRWRQMNGKVI